MNHRELAELDLAVARAEVHDLGHIVREAGKVYVIQPGYKKRKLYQPTRDGAEAMRLLEKFKLNLKWYDNTKTYCAGPNSWYTGWPSGPTPAIAICRAIVALKEKK